MLTYVFPAASVYATVAEVATAVGLIVKLLTDSADDSPTVNVPALTGSPLPTFTAAVAVYYVFCYFPNTK